MRRTPILVCSLFILLFVVGCDDTSNRQDPCQRDCIHGQCSFAFGEESCICDQGYQRDGDGLCTQCAAGKILSKGSCIDDPCANACTGLGEECKIDDGKAKCQCQSGYQDNDKNGSCLPTCEMAGYAQCDDSSGIAIDLSPRSCETVFHFDAGGSTGRHFGVGAEFNGWDPNQLKMTEVSAGVYEARTTISAGVYGYKFVDLDNNDWFKDPHNPTPKYVGTEENSRIVVTDCNQPLLELVAEPTLSGSDVSIYVRFVQGADGSAINGAPIAQRGGETATVTAQSQPGVYLISDTGLEKNKYAYTISATDAAGREARLWVPVWVEDVKFTWRDALLYFAMTDRFNNGNTTNDHPTPDVPTISNWKGGDIAGLKAKIEDGYFASLGVNTLWISSISMNTDGKIGDGARASSGYHSYWPISTGWTATNPMTGVMAVDPHFGTLDEFKTLVDVAHRNGIRVILDFVANHVHVDSPLWQNNQNDTWFNLTDHKVCSADNDKWWDIFPITCWFGDELPDFHFESDAPMDTIMAHARWLMLETNIDGFRLDAVKHMIDGFAYRIREEVDALYGGTGIRFYMVGETFTYDVNQLKRYANPAMLDGQFDFRVYDKVKAILLKNQSNMRDLEGFTKANDNEYHYDDNWPLMANFMGNHDVPRAINESLGNLWDKPKEQAFEAPVPPVTDPDAYLRLRLAWAYILLQPTIPMIYYGDEFGLEGAGDPGNRRMMVFSGINGEQQKTLDFVKKLGTLRSQHAAIRRGERATVLLEDYRWAYTLTLDGEKVLVVLNRDNAFTVDLRALGKSDNWQDLLTGADVADGKADVPTGSAGVFLAK